MITPYEANFRRLLDLIPQVADLKPGHYLRFEAGESFMPLSVDVLDRDRRYLRVALAHNFVLNGDLVPDPDMELRVDFELRTVEALTYQDQRRYDEVYPAPGQIRIAAKFSLNSFLSTWLTNIARQGFRKVEDVPPVD